MLPVTPRLTGADVNAGEVRTLRRTYSSPVFRLASQDDVTEAEAVEVTAEGPR